MSEQENFDALKHALEPAAFGSPMSVSIAQISAAISLKRIADALNEPNEYGEIGSLALSGAIVRGLRGGRWPCCNCPTSPTTSAICSSHETD